jgi:hypothetical protein
MLTHRSFIGSWCAAAGLMLAFTTLAQAQVNQRTFVSTTGTDAGTCLPSAPCRTFTYALTQTLSGGEIVVLTSGGYGAVEITKAVQITSPIGVYAAITALSATAIGGTDAIRVNAAATDIVVIRGLTLNNVGVTDANGITFPSGARLYVENCVINGFDNHGISVDRSTSGSPELYVTDTTIRNGGTGDATDAGIFLRQTTNANVIRTTIDNCRLERAGQYGLFAADNTWTTVRNTVSVRSFFGGFLVTAATGTTAQLNLENCTATFTNGTGVIVGVGPFSGGAATVRLSNTLIATNSIDGISVNTNNTAHISHSTINGNADDGVTIGGVGATAEISDSIIKDNGGDGIQLGNNTAVFVTFTTISGNGGKGLYRVGGISDSTTIGSNRIFNNVGGSDNFSATVSQQ